MSRTVQFGRYGGVEVLELVDLPQPVAGEGELLVRVKASGINPFESKVRRGLMSDGTEPKAPLHEGSDLAGVVEAVGPGVSGFAPGAEIAGAASNGAAHAEFALASAGTAVAKPANVPWEVAGALWVVGTTAYAAVRAVGAGDGDVVLVSGASGGVGGLAVQLARRRGASVIGVASERNHAWLRAHDVTPVAYGDGLRDRVEAALAQLGRPLSALVDTSGAGYVELGLELGVAPQRINTIADFGAVERHSVKAEGSAQASTAAVLAELLALLDRGELELPIHRVFSLDQVQAAYTELEHGHPRGKIVLRP